MSHVSSLRRPPATPRSDSSPSLGPPLLNLSFLLPPIAAPIPPFNFPIPPFNLIGASNQGPVRAYSTC